MNPLTSTASSRTDSPPDPKKSQSTVEAGAGGTLPVTVAVVLFLLTGSGITLLATQIGVAVHTVGIALIAGLTAGWGVRIATRDQESGIRVALSVCVLWAASLTFVGSLVSGILQSALGIQPVMSMFSVVSVAFLVPYGIIGGATRQFGHGAAAYALKRYGVGTGVLSIMAVLLAIGTQFGAGIDAVIGVVSGVSVPDSIPLDSTIVRMWINCALMIGSVLGIRGAVSRLPLEVFAGVNGMSRISEFRRYARKSGTYALLILLVTPFGGTILSEADLPIDSPAVDTATTVALGLSAEPLTTVFSATVGLLIGGFILAKTASRITNINPQALTEYVAPPVGVTCGTYVVVSVFSEQISQFTTNASTEIVFGLTLQEVIQNIQSIYSGNPETPVVIVLGFMVLALVASAVVLLLPSIFVASITSSRRGSLVGVASASSAMALLAVTVAISGGTSPFIIAGVVCAVIVWEFGEYSLVAASELSPPPSQSAGDTARPASIGKLLTVHGVIVGVIGCIGGVVAMIAVTGAAAVAIPQQVAILTVALTSIGLAGVVQALSG